MDIPSPWEKCADEVIRDRLARILVIGGVDRGKSTFCRFLASRLLQTGEKVALVDADIGQKDIGPPATITTGYPDAGARLKRIPPAGFYFVGSVGPFRHFLPMVVGTKLLVDAAEAAFVIVNTTGLIEGAGRILKGFKIENVNPDIVVAIDRSGEAQPILDDYRHRRTTSLPASELATPKSPEQRKINRIKAFAEYFSAAREITLPAGGLAFQRYASYGDPLARASRNLLCGLARGDNRCLGLGILLGSDGQSLRFLTPVTGEISIVQLGDMFLAPDGRELASGSKNL
jgi:polynucleotide 5'-hydroxyl-kinase GRC3/NOL9